MAIVSIKEFGAMTGYKPGNIHTMIGRKKLIKNAEGRIDIFNEINAAFLEMHKHKGISFAAESIAAGRGKVKNKSVGAQGEVAEQDPGNKGDNEIIELEKRYKRAATENKEKENILKQIEIDKKNGMLIDTEAVKMLFFQQRKTIILTVRQFIEAIIEPFIIKYKLTPEDAAFLRKETVAELNKTIDTWEKEGKKGIKDIVERFGEERKDSEAA